jgi:chromosome segregation ATPase
VQVTELDDIRQRLGALEQRVDVLEDGHADDRRAAELFAVVDRDVADLKEAFSAQRHVLQALRETQLEQGRALVDQGRAIGGVIVTLQSIQQSQEAMQQTQQSMQAEIQALQSDMGSVKSDMGSVKDTLAEHGRVLARLDPGEDPA